MLLRTLARPYAKALLSFVKTPQERKLWLEALKESASLLGPRGALHRLANHPQIPKAVFEDLLLFILEKQTPKLIPLKKTLSNFFHLIINTHRIFLVPSIAAMYHELLLEKEHVLEAELKVAFPLSSNYQNKIETALSKKFNTNVQLHVHVEPALIGGAVLQIGDWVLNNSVKNKLERLVGSLVG